MLNKRIITTALSLFLVVLLALTMVSCGGDSGSSSGSKGSPKDVVNTFFDAIDKQDAKKFLGCFEKDVQKDILEYTDEDEIEDQLKALDEMLEDEYSKSWRKKIKVTGSEKVDTDDDITYYEVTVEFDGEEETMTVMKIKNKYYLDPDTFYDFM
jgi:ketosteroid isomerase-like protein